MASSASRSPSRQVSRSPSRQVSAKAESVVSAEDDGDKFHKEVEVLLAEMETRLRRSVLKVVRPTLDQVADLSGRLSALERLVEKHGQTLSHSETMEDEVKRLDEMFVVVRDRLQAVSEQIRVFEGSTTTELAELRTHTFNTAIRLDSSDAEVQKMQKDFGSVWEEDARLQQQHDETAQRLLSNIAGAARKAETGREDILERIADVQKVHYQLSEDIFGDGKALPQIRVELAHLGVAVEPLPRLETKIEEATLRGEEIEELLRQTEKASERVAAEFASLKDTVDTRLENYNDNSRSVMNQLSAFHASMLKNIRNEFNEEMRATKQIREDMSTFESGARQLCQDLSVSLHQEIARVDASHHELAVDIEGLQHRWKNESVHIKQNLQRLERDSHIAQEASDQSSRRIDHLGKVMALVLEGEKMANALHIQEFADRCCECWLGTATDAKRQPPATHTAHTLEKWQPHYEHLGKGIAGDDLVSLVPVNMQTGFAKLGYLPGTISYGGKLFDRKGFLLMHHQMLTKARQFLQAPAVPLTLSSSPRASKRILRNAERTSEDASAAAKISLQPRANGGQGGSEASGPPKSGGQPGGWAKSGSAEEFKPVPSGSAGSGPAMMAGSDGFRRSDGFQRPGSQNQPQAMGSKGSMSGALGLTSPPTEEYRKVLFPDEPPRLPDIGSGTGQDKIMVAETKKKSVDLALRPKAMTAR